MKPKGHSNAIVNIVCSIFDFSKEEEEKEEEEEEEEDPNV